MKTYTGFFLAVIYILSLYGSPAAADSGGDDKKVIHEKSFRIQQGKKLILDTDTGDIIITPWDKNEVSVKVTGNENAAKKLDYDFIYGSEEIRITAEKKGGGGWLSNINLKFEIKVPGNFNIKVNTSGGDIRIAGVNGDLNLRTSGGDIWADRFEGNFSAKTSGGDINLFAVTAKIEAVTSGGDIELEYTGINQGIELKTSGGDIEIKLPVNFDAKAELRTSGGEVECGLKLSDVKKLSKTRIYADINKGGKPLTALTSGGDIKVFRR